MNHQIIKNYITFLANVMKANGCTKEIRDCEDILANLYYLSKEDGKGSRYMPLQYKRIVEKILFDLNNTAFEYTDREDVYYEKIGNTVLCCANVYFVQYTESGERKVLGHGYHSLSLNEVFPGSFMPDDEKISKWKSTVIGGAKSRALYDAGIGLEFYGDIFTPEENLDEADVVASAQEKPKAERKPRSRKVKEETLSETGMPIPQPKRKEQPSEEKAEVPKAEPVASEPDPIPLVFSNGDAVEELSLEDSFAQVCDMGNYKGMTLGEIYKAAPKNIIFLARRAEGSVQKAALQIIASDEDLKAKYEG